MNKVADGFSPSPWLIAAVVVLALVATMGAIFGGPLLGDHEAFVAICARNMMLSGDWIVPDFEGTPWIRKTPLPYWLVIASSYLFPNDAHTNLPVSTVSARVPNTILAFLTILMLWRLGSSMFSPRAGIVTAVVACSTLMFLLYSPNATAEMTLTCCCTWCFLHFWYAATTRSPRKRFIHAMMFYVAFGFAMLAKGPAPIAMVAAPLVFWWYMERPLRILAARGFAAWRRVLSSFFRRLWPRTIQAVTRLWLVPGLVVFAVIFLPWVLLVAARYHHAWDLWNWQYLQRAAGNYEDTRPRGPFYYIPIVIGMVMPWVFLLLEAVVSPWLKRYVRQRRGLVYAGLVALLGIVAMSMMEFKKPYYICAAIPGLILMLGVVAERFYAWTPPAGPAVLALGFGRWRRAVHVADARRVAWIVLAVLTVAAIGGLIGGVAWMRREFPTMLMPATILAVITLVILAVAGGAYIRGRGWVALAITAVTMIGVFHVVWYQGAAAIDAASDYSKLAALTRVIDDMKLPPKARVVWPVTDPIARLGFYFNRHVGYMVKPEEIVTRIKDRVRNKGQLHDMVLTRANELLRGQEPVYFVIARERYDMFSAALSKRGKIVATVADPRSSEDDWVIVSNVGAR
jgi:4-amino-4-deoxy-L-arabinose transferase-like glycosyltransferase